jgi:hypothetical protein
MPALNHEQYMEKYELYLLNKKIDMDKDLKNKKCFACTSGSLEVSETTDQVIIKCNSKSCESFKLKLPEYHLFDETDIIDNIENNPNVKPERKEKKKIEDIKKYTEQYDIINDIKNRRDTLDELLAEYNLKKKELDNLSILYKSQEVDVANYTKLSAQLNKDLIAIKNNIIEILNPDEPKLNPDEPNQIFIQDPDIKPRLTKV